MTPAVRAALDEVVEALIGLLDAVDGDPELEDGDADEAAEDEGWGGVCWRAGL